MNKKSRLKVWAIALWLIIWEIAALALNQEIFLVAPHRAALRFLELAGETEFWVAAVKSTGRIICGFLMGLGLGVLLGGASAKYRRVNEFLAPMVLAVKSVPVASFVILAIICFSSRYLSILITFLIVFPLIYSNTLSGIEGASEELLEMGRVFRLPAAKIRRYIYAPTVMAFLRPAISTAVGMAWKAGIAAEVIGIPRGSIGAKIQQAKVYLETPDLIAWTLAVIILSALSEKLFVFLLNRVDSAVKKSPDAGAFIPEEEAGDAAGRGAAPEIILKGIKKSYGNEDVIDGLSCNMEAGELTVVMGESGVGKTTLLRIIAGLEAADDGEVCGTEGQKIGFMFQEDRLIDYMDGVGNIQLACPVGTRQIEEALKDLKLDGNNVVGKPVSELSGGQKRRVALIRILLSDSDILILDEPFKGLDTDTKDGAINFVKEKIRGKTAILVTHDENEAMSLGGNRIITFANSSY